MRTATADPQQPTPKKKTPEQLRQIFGFKSGTTVRVTPKLAKEWLTTNIGNRRIRVGQVKKYARDILSDNWWFTGDPIRHDDRGQLRDGQHRLSAIILADKPLRMTVLYGFPVEAVKFFDCGIPRHFGDCLNFDGEKHYKTLSSATRAVYLYKRPIPLWPPP